MRGRGKPESDAEITLPSQVFNNKNKAATGSSLGCCLAPTGSQPPREEQRCLSRNGHEEAPTNDPPSTGGGHTGQSTRVEYQLHTFIIPVSALADLLLLRAGEELPPLISRLTCV